MALMKHSFYLLPSNANTWYCKYVVNGRVRRCTMQSFLCIVASANPVKELSLMMTMDDLCKRCLRFHRSRAWLFFALGDAYDLSDSESQSNLRSFFANRYELPKGCECFMAKPKLKKSRVDEVQWVNYTLNKADLIACDKWGCDPAQAFVELQVMALNGYNFTIKKDSRSAALMVAVICTADDDDNYGCGLSARSSDLFDASKILLFKHLQIFGEAWPREQTDTSTPRG